MSGDFFFGESMNTNATNEVTNPKLLPIPDYLITPEDWILEAQRRATEYLGMPEGAVFLVEARRYSAMANKIRKLEAELHSTKLETMLIRNV